MQYLTRARRAIEAPRNRSRSPPFRDWLGRNKRGLRQGIVPHLRDRPFVGIGQSLGIFQASRPSFCPSFFLLGPLAFSLPAPSPFHNTGPLFSICSTLRRIGALASRRPTLAPFSFPAFIFIIIITVIRVSIFISGRRFVVSAQRNIIIIINGEKTSMPLRSLRFIVVYSSRTRTRIPGGKFKAV